MKHPISLQINTAPVDMAYLPKILSHQLADFAGSCEEVIVTIETKQSKKSRWKSDQWNDNLEKLYDLLEQLKEKYPHIRANPIDYSKEKRLEVSRYFLKNPKKLIPFKDFRGGPYYSYFFGLHSCTQRYVLHLDSDIILNGDGKKWIEQAISLIQSDQKALFVSPIIGPPVLEGQEMPMQHPKRYNPIEKYTYAGNGYKYKDVSTRIFLVEKERLKNFCPMTYPHLDQLIKALLKKTSMYHTPERSISSEMQRQGLYRVDFHGKPPGLYSIHAQVARQPDFVGMLDHVIQKVKEGFFLEEDRGLQDFNPNYLRALKESFLKEKNDN